jgi:hypothetical protein
VIACLAYLFFHCYPAEISIFLNRREVNPLFEGGAFNETVNGFSGPDRNTGSGINKPVSGW